MKFLLGRKYGTHKKNLSLAHKGKTLLESHPMRGKKQKTSQYPHCKKVGGVSNMVR